MAMEGSVQAGGTLVVRVKVRVGPIEEMKERVCRS
jgi:hypothetical protein